jgi:hypothetical protein
MPKPNPVGPFSPSPIDPNLRTPIHRCQATDRGKNCDRALRRRATFAAGRAPPPGGRRRRAPLPEAKPAALTAPALTPSNSRPTGTRRHFNLPRPPVPQPPTALSRRPKPSVSRAHCWLQEPAAASPFSSSPFPSMLGFQHNLISCIFPWLQKGVDEGEKVFPGCRKSRKIQGLGYFT